MKLENKRYLDRIVCTPLSYRITCSGSGNLNLCILEECTAQILELISMVTILFLNIQQFMQVLASTLDLCLTGCCSSDASCLQL